METVKLPSLKEKIEEIVLQEEKPADEGIKVEVRKQKVKGKKK